MDQQVLMYIGGGAAALLGFDRAIALVKALQGMRKNGNGTQARTSSCCPAVERHSDSFAQMVTAGQVMVATLERQTEILDRTASALAQIGKDQAIILERLKK